ncbi:phosphomethylpyrimidine synthase ThiC [Dissulfurirhabdus thermomarina]|uniref:Phosphomethylpyrimidine synthase n=1 Tax=Dissulfurirhabdus thermomarina TaxID=1765737 RepID=A0A6N9TQK3_DISTH|nr:phosphomethylpyrimidine synthase ThiC [Dissulfurirhabdus thermomarina]NDY43338.1 phosphomethylpyrimidine synthase ThiC [Dissulfurirhabdus thermomarina]NMX22433.1 phosphomethylpyrimidine synthase ThiC [Dissulfurirhabdus thermomarina]
MEQDGDKTILETARDGGVSDPVRRAAEAEGVSAEALSEAVGAGQAVIPHNRHVRLERPMAVGRGLSTKVNANIGTSKDHPEPEPELEKLRVALDAGAHAVMDLSTGGPIREIRRAIREACPVPLGTVPVYQAAVETVEQRGRSICEMDVDDLFRVIEEQAQEGVDFMTVHAGLTLEGIERLARKERLMGVVSRGGSLVMEWMMYNRRENPLYERFDDLLAIAREHEVTLSLGDGLRPGCLHDATDGAQVHELIILGELTLRAWEAGVQVMIEGPGHMPMDQIAANMLLEKRLCHGAPFYVLGPLVTDIAPGYDHITSAIGGAIAAAAGADFLCYVTPAEHLKLPSLEDVKEGVIAARIAAHAADIAKGVPGALDQDRRMAEARHRLDWQTQIDLSLDPEKARLYRDEGGAYHGPTCTMCGDYCAIKTYKRAMRLKAGSGGA